MRVKYKYISEYSDFLINYITEKGLEHSFVNQGTLSRLIIFYTFDNLDYVIDDRILGCKCVGKCAIYTEEEYRYAEWFSFESSKPILSLDILKHAFSYLDHTMKQTQCCTINKDGYKYPVVSPKNHAWLMFCNRSFYHFCKLFYDDIIFEHVIKTDGTVNQDLFQIDSRVKLPIATFCTDASDTENRATVHHYSDADKIYTRDPETYIPTIKNEYIQGHDIVSSENIWGSGFGYRMFFCSARFYNSIMESQFKNCFLFKPVRIFKE